MISTYPLNDRYGTKDAGLSHLFTERHIRRLRETANKRIPRPHNGIYDATTYYHLLDYLLRIRIGNSFNSKELTGQLNENKTMLLWDTVTVGRILADIAESAALSLGFTNDKVFGKATAQMDHHAVPLTAFRKFSGMEWTVRPSEAGRVLLFKLLDDLAVLSETQLTQEKTGRRARTESPLAECPSM